MKTLDRAFGCLMVLGGIGHTLGSLKVYGKEPMTLLWALSASLAVFLLAALNLLRSGANPDRRLAWICAIGCLAWVGFALRFGVLVGNVFDFRPLLNAVIALVLAIFSVRTALSAQS
jgi:hypothetical protein